jgi:hypothetical protein
MFYSGSSANEAARSVGFVSGALEEIKKVIRGLQLVL